MRRNINNNEVEEAILRSYEAVETVKIEREKDWKTTLNLRLVIVASKMAGLGLQIWSLNLDDWASNENIVSDVSTNYYTGVTGRAVLYALLVLEDLRY